MPSWLKIATWFLLASLVTFSLKKPLLFWQNININDLLLAASFVCLAIAAINKEIRVSVPRKAVWVAALAVGSMVLATVLSRLSLGSFAPDALREYVRIFAGFIICLEIYAIGIHDKSFFGRALLALVASTLLLPFIFYVSGSYLPFFIDESATRFTGFLFDPNYYASLQILPTFILLWMAYKKPYGTQAWLFVATLALLGLSISSIIWSGSRGGILGLIGSLAVLLMISAWKQSTRKTAPLLLLILLGCLSAYVLTPRIGRSNISSRMHSIVERKTVPVTEALTAPAPGTHTKPFVPNLTAHQGRGAIWKSALSEIVRNPLGYGPDYGPTANVTGAHNDHHRVAHNTALQVALTGGIVLLVIVMLCSAWFSKRVLMARIPFGEAHFLFSSLVGIALAGLFLDSLWSRWVWIAIGLILVYLHHEEMA